MKLPALLLLALLVTACGQTGTLYLPGESRADTVEPAEEEQTDDDDS